MPSYRHPFRALLALIAVLLLSGCSRPSSPRHRLDLGGNWETHLGSCLLPGTTDESHLGPGLQDTTITYQLSRNYPYSGVVTYTREIELPATMEGRRLTLFIERTKPSTLWIDDDSIGHHGHLYAPHVYELPALTAGKHQLRLVIDNSSQAIPQECQGSHAWTDATQTNWNGVLGDFYIEATSHTYIKDVQVLPDVETRTATVRMTIVSDRQQDARLQFSASAWNTPWEHRLPTQEQSVALETGENILHHTLDMGNSPLLWSEFHPALYHLTVDLQAQGEKITDRQETDFGMRTFGSTPLIGERGDTVARQLTINGLRTFLRGKHDACVFPLTGYAPMDVEAWQKVFREAKAYGINHYRCHSYAPPRAAFLAADIEGIYLQPELPIWGSIDTTTVELNAFLLHEGHQLLDWCGNSPSFMMLGLGNELWGDFALMRSWLDTFREQDPRHLYNYGGNYCLGWQGAKEGEDCFITCRVGGGDRFSTHVRSSFSFADAEGGGILNANRPNTSDDYARGVRLSPRPVVSHESGQFQIYPDYDEIRKYTGVLRPQNLEIFRRRLIEVGMEEQAKDFHRATGLWSAECYKADIEYCLRTRGMAGFELLDLQDYPGQGSALVGLLDAFMESKGILTAERFRGFCSPVVPLALMDSLCFNTEAPIRIRLAISNYLEEPYSAPLRWSVKSEDQAGTGFVEEGEILSCRVPQGDVAKVGLISLDLSTLTEPKELTLTLTTGEYSNDYRFWVYPTADTIALPLTRSLAEVRTRLATGGTVLFCPEHRDIEAQSVGGLFTPDYWNYAMFKTISENAGRPISPGTLGLLFDPKHPLFRLFPARGHSDWQWWAIQRHSRPLILDGIVPSSPALKRPLIQMVDNIERNHRLALLIEAKVGPGRLLLCLTDLEAIRAWPEGRQYRQAIATYMRSSDFAPSGSLTIEEVEALLSQSVAQRNIVGVENKTDYTAQ